LNCKVCRAPNAIQHHLSYRRNITVPLCRSCHRKAHYGKIAGYAPIDKPPRSRYPKVHAMRLSEKNWAFLWRLRRRSRARSWDELVEYLVEVYAEEWA